MLYEFKKNVQKNNFKSIALIIHINIQFKKITIIDSNLAEIH